MLRERLTLKGRKGKRVNVRCDLAKIEMIQLLIPLGMQAVEDALLGEVAQLVGARYAHDKKALVRWGNNPGSVFLGDQKLAIAVPRVRNRIKNEEVSLENYEALQSPQHINEKMYQLLVRGISQRDYESAATTLPETFGIKKSTLSRRFIVASAEKLKELMERDLSAYDIVAIIMDGKSFAETGIIIAIGVCMNGKKVVLGFIESGTENETVIKDFFSGLQDRKLDMGQEILFVLDGAKGFNKGIKKFLGEKGIIQRCQWHKRENVVSYLAKVDQERIREKLQDAYNKSTYQEAKDALAAIEKELRHLNLNAVNSLKEGLEETLTLHQLGLYDHLGRSFKTTNCMESINRQLGKYTDRVCYWKNSEQKQRWVASALLEIEPKLRKVHGYRHLGMLRERMKYYNKDVKSKQVA